MDKLTSKFQQALGEAQSLALGKDHQFIEPLHVMLALLDQEGGSVKPLLQQVGVQVNALRNDLNKDIDSLASVSGSGGDVQLSNELSRILNLTDKLAQKREELFKPILDKVNSAMEAVAKENQFMFVFDLGTQIILYADETLDVTKLVKAKLGIAN